jgi:acyl dehydratase
VAQIGGGPIAQVLMREPQHPTGRSRRTAESAARYWDDIRRRSVRWDAIEPGWRTEWEITVSQDAINGYCDGVEDRNPWYGPYATEIGDPIAPPLLLSHACKDVMRPLGTSAGHVLTIHNTHIFAPCRVNTRVRFRAEIVAKFVKRGRLYRRERTEAVDAETDAPLLLDVREYTMGDDPDPARTEDVPEAILPPLPTGALGQVPRDTDTPAIGEALPSVEKEMHLVLMKMRSWGGHNAIHWDPALAEHRGFTRPIAAGQMTSASLAEMCVDYFGPIFFRDARIACRFVKPVYAGDTVRTHGHVRAVEGRDGRARIYVDLWAENQDAEKVVVGNAESWWE